MEHNSSIKSLEKLIITPLVTVLDCQLRGSLSVQGASGDGCIQRWQVLHLSAQSEVWIAASSASDLPDFPAHALKIECDVKLKPDTRNISLQPEGRKDAHHGLSFSYRLIYSRTRCEVLTS